jgi:hypothetical protein
LKEPAFDDRSLLNLHDRIFDIAVGACGRMNLDEFRGYDVARHCAMENEVSDFDDPIHAALHSDDERCSLVTDGTHIASDLSVYPQAAGKDDVAGNDHPRCDQVAGVACVLLVEPGVGAHGMGRG